MRRLHPIVIALLLFTQTGCGGGSPARNAPDNAPLVSAPDESAGATVVEREGFSLNVLPGSFQFGGQAEFSLGLQWSGSNARVTVVAAAHDLRAALLELRYPREMHPVSSESPAWPGTAREDHVALTMLDAPGAVHFGDVLTRPQERTGVSGEFSLLTVEFAAGPALAPRLASAVPSGGGSAIPDLAVDWGTETVTFSYYNLGDYNQDSLVNISDVTPIGQHYNETPPDFPELFDPATLGSVIDGNNDGLIYINDLTPIGANYLSRVVSWRLYGGAAGDYPENAGDDNGTATEQGAVEFTDTTTVPNEARLVMSKAIPGLGTFAGEALWLRPVGDEADEGIASNMVDASTTDRDPPVWTFDPDGVGVIEVIPLDGAARVIWGPATDASPFVYRGWVQEGATVDFNAAPDFEIAPSDPPDPQTDQISEVTGLSNDSAYIVAVRARDEYGNETDNSNTLSVTPLALAEVPAALDETTAPFNGPMVISTGASVLVTGGECIHFMGDLTIEEGATLEGQDDGLCIILHGNLLCDGTIILNLPDTLPGDPEDAPSLHIVVMGNVTFGDTSVVSGNGNIYIVDDPDELLPPQKVADNMDLPSDPGEFPFQLDYEDGGAVAAGGRGASAADKAVSSTTYYGPRPWARWLVKGNWGKVPTQPRGVTRVVMRVWPVNGYLRFQDFSIEGPDARDGSDDHSCNAHGGDGQDNRWRFRIHCGNSLDFHNVNIKLGNGGKGGNATTPQDCNPGVAVGGNGGDALNKFRFTARSAINITGTFSFEPGNGGDGGSALAWGRDGDDGCLAEDGADASATGGDGGNVPRWGVRTRGAVNGTGNVSLGTAEGGAGGPAAAWAGWGGNDECCPGAVGGSGGYAEATGGEGGDSKFSDGGSGAAGGGATGGDGGQAEAVAGSGGDGASWWKIPGGDGGGGGDADAVAGQGGEATGDGALTQGQQGPATAIGGNGGDGGDGLPPGVGGPGGDAEADGNPPDELDGVPGSDGEQSPLFLSAHLIIPAASFPMGPVAPGDYIIPIYCNDTMEQIGTMTMTLATSGGAFQVVVYPPSTTVLQLTGAASIMLDKSTVVYDDPADNNPWIGVDYTHYLTVGDVGLGYWYDSVPLDDHAIPEYIGPPEQTLDFDVDPGLFYEKFEPDPLVPPQWDACEIYTDAFSSTEIIEIIIIDP